MLVLSRKEGERIQIGDQITVVISKIAGNRVSIGIEAPRDLKVVRGELEWHDVPSTLPLEMESKGKETTAATGDQSASRSPGLKSFTDARRQVG
jgi:carbon storage regulator